MSSNKFCFSSRKKKLYIYRRITHVKHVISSMHAYAPIVDKYIHSLTEIFPVRSTDLIHRASAYIHFIYIVCFASSTLFFSIKNKPISQQIKTKFSRIQRQSLEFSQLKRTNGKDFFPPVSSTENKHSYK